MRVALATSSYAPYIGGVEEHVQNVAKILSQRGHDVEVWTVDRSGGHGTVVIDNVRVRTLPAPLPARSARSLWRYATRLSRSTRLWRQAARAHRPEIIHVQCFGPNGTYARALARHFDIPLVISTHGETLADDANVFSQSRFAAWSLRRGLANATAVTACSRFALADLTSRFGLREGRGIVVFNGVDLHETGAPRLANTPDRYLASIGRMVPVKGFDLLIRAFARASLPEDVHLVIAGDGPERDGLARLAAELGVEDRLLLPGWLDRAAVVALLRNAAISVVPSRLESFGIAVLEAWRAETPVVATTHGGPREFVHDGVDGLLVDPEDTPALGAALRHLFDDVGLARSLALAGTKSVQAFTWERSVDSYEAIYGAVVSSESKDRP